MADKLWATHKPEIPTVAAILAENSAALKDSDDLENPAVAAIRKQATNKSNRGGGGQSRGQNHGQRGSRGQNCGGSHGARQPQGPKHPRKEVVTSIINMVQKLGHVLTNINVQ